MESVNSFSGGMSSDASKLIQQNGTYLQALNFRGLTELGGSNGSLVNIKGNDCGITFPNLEAVYKLIVIPGTWNEGTNTVIFTINGVTESYLNITNFTTGLDIYNFIVRNYTGCYQNQTVATKTFSIAYDNNYVIFYQQPVYQNCSPIASVPVIISTLHSETIPELPTLQFTNGATNTLIQDLINPYVKGVTSDLIIPIGSTFILDDIYIFTAKDDPTFGLGNGPNPLVEKPENDSLTANGAIWKLSIDDITKSHTLTLLYSNRLDFTKYHPIPPSATSGRYESATIKRIYWSDNYNKIRTVNAAMPQLMALDPTILNVMPKVEYTQGILNSIITGTLPAGCYQMAYRLSKVLGSVTNFSELTNPVYLTANPEGTPFQEYVGNLGASTKGIKWTLTNLDTNYDQIEFVVSYRDSSSAIPVITSVGTKILTTDMSLLYTTEADPDFTTVTLDEFLLFNGTFTHAKTCDTKDNRLFWGNVRTPQKSLDSFDARAFRANFAGEIRLTNLTVPQIYSTWEEAALTDVTSDAINEYYDENGNYSANACYLKPGSSTILGGKGTNISYEFGTTSFNSDNDLSIDSSENWDISRSGAPFRMNDYTTGNPTGFIYDYPQNGGLQAMKQPERTSLFRGFQHEEIYRFGIQFFDKEGNPYFTNWIGDIKMPSYGDYNNNPDTFAASYGISDFRLSFATSYSKQYEQSLYIKFTVNVGDVQELISGYEIVRVKRTNSDKTIHGVGMINPVVTTIMNYDGGEVMLPAGWDSRRGIYAQPIVPGVPFVNKRYYTPYPGQGEIETLNIDWDTDNAVNSETGKIKSFDCWDFDAGLRPSFTAGDKILVRSQLKCVNYRGGSYPGVSSYRMYFGDDPKGHTSSPPTSVEVPLNNAMIDNGLTPPFSIESNNDSVTEPFFIMKMLDNTMYCNYQNFLSTNSYDYIVTEGKFIAGNSSDTVGGRNVLNYGKDIDSTSISGGATGNPCFGKQALFVHLDRGLYTSDYGCGAYDTEFKKLLALYYKPNYNIYGGPTYVDRTTNEYIPCGEYIATSFNNLPINIGNITPLTFKCYGGDVFTTIYDSMKTVKTVTNGSEYWVYEYNSSGVPSFPPIHERKAMFSTIFYYPGTSVYNTELRTGFHTNKDLTATNGAFGWNDEDGYEYQSYCNAENNTKVYFPKPLNFESAYEWNNRIYFSEVKYNNELLDSWSQYLTNNFYDVEGNYGPINALVSLKENMYYIQQRGVGMLMINPVSMVNDQLGTPIKLGGSDKTIQKHYYKSIDSGTSHQWSVYRSQSVITFVDVRHKKIYLFDGESVTPLSDLKGQRNFTIKRLHTELLKNDNPIINKGVLVTYDYYHNEFLYTFNNVKVLSKDPFVLNTTDNENLTLAYSEPTSSFSSMYSFVPNLYINSNKYLISTVNTSNSRDGIEIHNKLWFHNYGKYANFYGTQYPSTLKYVVNDNPVFTKVYDDLVMTTEAIDDNVEWSDDLNIYPGSPTNPLYPDDVNIKDSTFDKVRFYNQYQNTDWTPLDPSIGGNLRKVEQGFNLQIPRNKFNYDLYPVSTSSIFDPSKLTKIKFGDRLRDKWVNIDLSYNNVLGLRFIVHNIKTLFRISDR